MVWQGPRLGYVAETGRFVTVDALSTISCFCALLPIFRIFSCLIPVLVCLSSSCSFVCASVICYSQPLRIIRSTCSFLCHVVSCLISKFICFYSFVIILVVLISRWRCLLCSRTRYAGAWFVYLDCLATFGFLCLTVCDYIICISLGWRIRKNTGTADVIG